MMLEDRGQQSASTTCLWACWRVYLVASFHIVSPPGLADDDQGKAATTSTSPTLSPPPPPPSTPQEALEALLEAFPELKPELPALLNKLVGGEAVMVGGLGDQKLVVLLGRLLESVGMVKEGEGEEQSYSLSEEGAQGREEAMVQLAKVVEECGGTLEEGEG